MVSRKPDDVRAEVNPKPEERKIKTYTKEERWATGKGWGPGGKGCIVPKKKSQWITQEEYDRIQGVANENSEDVWHCPNCGVYNVSVRKSCRVCGTYRPVQVEDVQEQLRELDIEMSQMSQSGNRKASATFDWQGFMKSSKHPTIVNYLTKYPENLINFREHKDCSSEAWYLEKFCFTEAKLKLEYTTKLKSAQSYTGPVPADVSESVARCRCTLKNCRATIKKSEEGLEGKLVSCIEYYLRRLGKAKAPPTARIPRTKKKAVKPQPSRVPEATRKLDWKQFLKQCKDPIVVDYLKNISNHQIDFDQVESCRYTANRLEASLQKQKKIKDERRSRSDLKEIQNTVEKLQSQLEVKVVRHLEEEKTASTEVHEPHLNITYKNHKYRGA